MTGLEFTATQRLGRPLGNVSTSRGRNGRKPASRNGRSEMWSCRFSAEGSGACPGPEHPKDHGCLRQGISQANALMTRSLRVVADPQKRLKIEILQQSIRPRAMRHWQRSAQTLAWVSVSTRRMETDHGNAQGCSGWPVGDGCARLSWAEAGNPAFVAAAQDKAGEHWLMDFLQLAKVCSACRSRARARRRSPSRPAEVVAFARAPAISQW